MIDRYKLLEKKFSNVHNHLELVAIENIAIPITKIEVEVIGLQVDDILPTTEFILRFVDLGIDTVELLSEALGFDKLLVENLLVSEEKSGNLRLFPQTNSVKLTMQGRETLTTKLATAPKVTTKQVLFDNCFWKISSWNLRDFSHRAALDKAQIEYMSLAKTKKSRVLQTDLGVNPKQLIPAGRSSYIPLVANDTPANRAKNRRTRIIIMPKIDQFYDMIEKEMKNFEKK